ncbi:MAG: hypothetical protein HY507_02130 [Candidatus Zambryskibacteria bacterium]|nr:hypothetical protein [Candidatus Zambryskibacteria bacterium]
MSENLEDYYPPTDPDEMSYDPESPEDAFSRYKRGLSLNEELLAGKKILDVGSQNRNFAKYIDGRYPNTKVVSIDKIFNQNISAQMSTENIAFQPESFDIVLAHGIPWDTEELKKSISEFLNILCPLGEIRIGTLWSNTPQWLELQTLLSNLKSQGLIEVEDIETEEKQYCVVIKKLS